MGDLSSAGDHKDLPKASGITSRSINPVYRGQFCGSLSSSVSSSRWVTPPFPALDVTAAPQLMSHGGALSQAHQEMGRASSHTRLSCNPICWVSVAGERESKRTAASLGEQVAPRVSVSPVDQRDLLSEVSIWHFQQFLTVVF
ncbi:hypothetical protein AV530_003585 [Patagioenas fasciata monilis]|uniref:Uncharacterized protein n=1 Tax=Patagioenas fasciata monilis TaxID=372326 RepID=A0A1V4KY59_PATFA|nr:hypothetical protein AV530_003585 [Patagioenas fasciata monilis]